MKELEMNNGEVVDRATPIRCQGCHQLGTDLERHDGEFYHSECAP